MSTPLSGQKWQQQSIPQWSSRTPERFHEHCSDEDVNGGDDHSIGSEDFSEPQRQRSRSFSDAEDIMNGVYTSSSSSNGCGGTNEYYETFPPEQYSSLPQNGLHHRGNSTALRNGNGSITNSHPPESSPLSSSIQPMTRSPFRLHGSHSPLRPHGRNLYLHHKGNAATRKRGVLVGSGGKSATHWIKCCLAAGFGAYIILLIRGSFLLHENNTYELTGPYAMLSRRQEAWKQQTLLMIREAEIRMRERSELRQQRTQPSSLPTSYYSDTSWYNILLMDQRTQSRVPVPKEVRHPMMASIDQLCGVHAKNASLAYPDLYPETAALNANSRVFITGILNPLGFHLALYLKERCGVEVIAGMDSMFPNTVEHRLELQERIQILTTNIPKLSKPILLPYVGLDSRQKKQSASVLDITGEFNLASLQPTHIVHLASYSHESFESQAFVDPLWKNTHSPYVSEDYDPPLYQIKNSMVGMEQILMAMAATLDSKERPHLVYASSTTGERQQESRNHRYNVHTTAKLVDEVMADTYYSASGVRSVGVRLPNTVFGPWSVKGSIVKSLIEATVQRWNATGAFSLPIPRTTTQLDLVYVVDAVDAVVAAMQIYQSQPFLVEVSSGMESSFTATAELIKSFSPNVQSEQLSSQQRLDKAGISQLLAQHALDGLLDSRRLQWSPSTSLYEGMLKTISWELNRAAPFGPSIVESADQFLRRHEIPTCAADDIICHTGFQYLPCLSECNTRDQCIRSVFDSVKELMITTTEGCDIVLYTQSLGHDVDDLKLEGEYMDEQSIANDDLLICNFAFVSQDSALVQNVVDRIPANQLAKFGVKPQAADSEATKRTRQLEKLNGRLLYRGWILIWVPDALEPLSVSDKFFLKLSPGRLFSPDVKRALFVEENFSVSPNIEDVQFLVDEMKRDTFGKRTIRKESVVSNPLTGRERKKTVKYRLPAEPPRRAAILFAPLRYPNKQFDGQPHKYNFDPDKKLSVHDASKFMRFEINLDPSDKEPVEIRRQREFYERIPSYLNRNELRATLEPWYRYSMRHWVRTRWVVHDMELEESRLLRCEWYQEHVQWGTDLDQLSFAHVMAKRELERRMSHHEPDDHIKSFIEEHPELHDLTDSYEWHAMETERNRKMLQSEKYREPISGWLSKLPDHMAKDAWEDAEGSHAELDGGVIGHDETPLFVRIMSEKMMAMSRKAWSRGHKKKKHKA